MAVYVCVHQYPIYMYIVFSILLIMGTLASSIIKDSVSCDGGGELDASNNISYITSCSLDGNGKVRVSIGCSFPDEFPLKAVFRNSTDLCIYNLPGYEQCLCNEPTTGNLDWVTCLLSVERVRGVKFSCLPLEGFFTVEVHYKCPHPTVLENATLLSDRSLGFPLGSNFSYRCKEGFLPAGNLMVTCSIPSDQPNRLAMWEKSQECVPDNSSVPVDDWKDYLKPIVSVVSLLCAGAGIVILIIIIKMIKRHRTGHYNVSDQEAQRSETSQDAGEAVKIPSKEKAQDAISESSYFGSATFNKPESVAYQGNSDSVVVPTGRIGADTSNARRRVSRGGSFEDEEVASSTAETYYKQLTPTTSEQPQPCLSTLELQSRVSYVSEQPSPQRANQDSVDISIVPPTEPTVKLVYSKLEHIALRSVSCLAKELLELELNEGDPKENLMKLIEKVFKIFHSRTATAKITKALKAIGENELAGELEEMFSAVRMQLAV